MYLNKANLDSEPPQLQHRLTFAIEVCYSCTGQIVIVRTCEQRSVECRLSFTVEVMTASENWKHPLPFKIIVVPVSNGYYV